jgi:large subunit ribosomal protein L35e
LTSQQRTALRKFYEGKKYLPLDLRAKKTRAQVCPFLMGVDDQRRALSKKDASRVTLRTKKIAQAFPAQKYALRA